MTLIKTTCAATFATLPLLIESFGVIPLVSIPANMILVPLVELIIVPLGLLSFLAFTVSEHIAVPLINVNIHFIRMMVFGIGLFLEIPYSSLSIPPLGALSLLLFLALGITVLLAARLDRVKYILPAIALALLASAAYPVIRKSDGHLSTASFLDTGGDRTIVFFELPGGGNVLIDGGYSNLDRKGYIERNVVGRFLLHSGVNRIDTLILTSADKDHLSGAEHILQNFDVGMVFTNGDKLGGELWGIIRDKNIAWKDLADSETISLGGDSRLDVLKPGLDFVIRDSSRPRPLAIRVAFRDVSIITGEALDDGRALSSLTKTQGERLMSSALYLRSFGGNDAFLSFLRAVSPRILITGEPVPSRDGDDPGLRKALSEIIVLDTSADGEVTLKTDGSGMSVENYSGEKKANIK